MKKNILFFIMGAIIFSGITSLAYNYNAKNIEYTPSDNSWDVSNVKDALDSINTNTKYNGSTEITPSTTDQTLQTKNKILKNNIKVNKIPTTYKNLTATTTATASDIISGKTAYDNNGNLITGNIENSLSISVSADANSTSEGTSVIFLSPLKKYKYFKISNSSSEGNVNSCSYRAYSSIKSAEIPLSTNVEYSVLNDSDGYRYATIEIGTKSNGNSWARCSAKYEFYNK